MKKQFILVMGSGRSSTALISYLLDKAEEENWYVIIVGHGSDTNTFIKKKVEGFKFGELISLDLKNEEDSRTIVQRADVVISLLPPAMHPQIARLCLAYKKHLFTASYVCNKMQAMNKEAKSAGLLFLNECGLDPGVDHMSTMQTLDKIKEKGGEILSFKSFAGGLIAPDTDVENPWRYKFTWNPQSVVKAGQGVAKFLHDGKYKYVSYCKLFKHITPVHIPDYGDFVGYANRDSLKYINLYGLNGIQTILRGTLRTKGFCTAWDTFVQLGCTDDTYKMKYVSTMTHRDFMDSFLPFSQQGISTVEEKVATFLGLDCTGPELERIRWSGCFENEKVGLDEGTPAQILEHILNKKWRLNPSDKDMIVLWHQYVYELDGKRKEVEAQIVCIGEDQGHTAMAKGVGLPLAIALKLFLHGKIDQRGVCLPIKKNLYTPILQELQSFGIKIKESTKSLP